MFSVESSSQLNMRGVFLHACVCACVCVCVCVCVRVCVESSSQLNMRGVFLHVLGDALGSVVVIVSALVIKFVDADWKFKVDPAMRQVTRRCFIRELAQTTHVHAPVWRPLLLDSLGKPVPEGYQNLAAWEESVLTGNVLV